MSFGGSAIFDGNGCMGYFVCQNLQSPGAQSEETWTNLNSLLVASEACDR
jgi:hypothetical protein